MLLESRVTPVSNSIALTGWNILNQITVEMQQSETPAEFISLFAQGLSTLGLAVIVGKIDRTQSKLIPQFIANGVKGHGFKGLPIELETDPVSLDRLSITEVAITKGPIKQVDYNVQKIQYLLHGYHPSDDQVLSSAILKQHTTLPTILTPLFSEAEDIPNYFALVISPSFEPAHIPLIETFRYTTLTTINNNYLQRQNKNQQKNAQTLREVSRIISSKLDLQKVLNSILEQLANVITYDSAAILLEYGKHLKLEAAHGFEQVESVLSISVLVEENPLYHQLKTEQRPIIINDVRLDDRYTQWEGTTPIRSWIGVPLVLQDQVIGQISIDSFTEYAFKEPEQELAFAFAQHVSTAIQNARLFEEINKRADELNALLDGARDVSTSLNTERVIYLIANRLQRLMNASVIVYLTNGKRLQSELKQVVLLETELDQLQKHDIIISRTLAQQAIDTKQGVIVSNVTGALLSISNDLQSSLMFMAAPFIIKDKTVGAIVLCREEGPIFDQPDIELLTRFAFQTSIAIENSRLYEALELRFKRENLINRLLHRLSSKLSLPSLATDIMQTAIRLAGADMATLILRDPADHNKYVHYVHENYQLKVLQQTTVRPNLAAQAIDSRQVIVANNLLPEKDLHLRWVEENVAGAIAIPISSGDQVLGALGIFKRKVEFSLSDQDVSTLEYIGRQAGVSFENALLFQQVNEYAQNLQEKVIERTAEIQKQQEQTEAILESAADAIVITSTDGIIEYTNPAFTDLTGYELAEIKGTAFDALLEEQNSSHVIRPMWNTVKTGKTWRGDIKNKHKNDQLYDTELTISPILDQNGQVEKFVAIQRDVSKKKELDRLKEEFLVTASHEFRTPLTTITGYSELLLNRHFSKGETDHFLKHIHEQANRVSNLVTDLLDVSRIEAGEYFRISPTLTNPASIFQESVQSWQGQSPAHTIILNEPSTWPQLNVDTKRLEQVLDRLLSNAVKFSPQGGNIHVTVEKKMTNLLVSIKDQGIGMSSDEQQYLFETFWRADASSLATEGAGVSLALVKQIIESHRGKIWVVSERNQGTTVYFTLPLQKGEATILIIEDDRSIIELQEKILSAEGYQVLTSQSGREGLELAKSQYPDLIILDLMLPEIEGEDILKQLKSSPATRNIPIVVVSAKSALANIEYTFTLGAVDFLTKPFDLDEYTGRIKIALLHNN